MKQVAQVGSEKLYKQSTKKFAFGGACDPS